MNFSEAKAAAIRGAKIRRAEWPVGQYIWVEHISYRNAWGDKVHQDVPQLHAVGDDWDDWENDHAYFAGRQDRGATDWETIK